ncbi:hypothetical protein QFC22_000019 [Naganishia vaughanmartiniae]|uniref:Uncharacterized protein n=1 Tax=Naganishia vaughanmartiniae TaxID=1424756 RepID=A0ACC2XPV8_9TREE|nr:hypothetical protein QFC22_000019 [Naganishia vaughanmartiniae]
MSSKDDDSTPDPTSSGNAVQGVVYWDEEIGAYVSESSLASEKDQLEKWANLLDGGCTYGGKRDSSSMTGGPKHADTLADVKYDTAIHAHVMVKIKTERQPIFVYVGGDEGFNVELSYPFVDGTRNAASITWVANWWKSSCEKRGPPKECDEEYRRDVIGLIRTSEMKRRESM